MLSHISKGGGGERSDRQRQIYTSIYLKLSPVDVREEHLNRSKQDKQQIKIRGVDRRCCVTRNKFSYRGWTVLRSKAFEHKTHIVVILTKPFIDHLCPSAFGHICSYYISYFVNQVSSLNCPLIIGLVEVVSMNLCVDIKQQQLFSLNSIMEIEIVHPTIINHFSTWRFIL